MARAKTLELLDTRPAPAPQPKLKRCCGTCAGWRPHNAAAWLGQCMPSGKFRQSPLETLDLNGCSNHAWREGLE